MAYQSEIIKDSWSFFKEHIKAIVFFMFPIIIVTSIISDLLVTLLPMTESEEGSSMEWLTMYAYFLIKANFYALDVALFLHYMKNTINETGLKSTLLIFTFLPRLPGLLLLTSLAASFIFLGLIAMILPGLWLALRFSYAWMYFSFENRNPFVSLYKSFKETADDTTIIIPSIIAIALPFAFFMVFYIIIAGIFLNNFFLSFSISILSSLVFLFLQVVLFRIYSQYGHKTD